MKRLEPQYRMTWADLRRSVASPRPPEAASSAGAPDKRLYAAEAGLEAMR